MTDWDLIGLRVVRAMLTGYWDDLDKATEHMEKVAWTYNEAPVVLKLQDKNQPSRSDAHVPIVDEYMDFVIDGD